MEGYDKVQDGEYDEKAGYVSEVLQFFYHQNCKNQLTLPPQIKLVGSCFRTMSAALGDRAVELQARSHCRWPEFLLVLRNNGEFTKKKHNGFHYMETDFGSP